MHAMTFSIQTFRALVFSGALLISDAKPLADEIRVPNVPSGNSSGGLGIYPSRLQQVYDAAAFGATPLLITGFRLHADGAFTATYPDIQFNLSTTGKQVDALSLIFAENLGLDDTAVYRDELYVNSHQTISIEFTAPFFYDPSAGNLLLDIRNHGGERNFFPNPVELDTHNIAGDEISYVVAEGATASMALYARSSGYITTFLVTPVPEPSMVSVLALTATLGVAFRACKRRRIIGRRPHVVK